MNRPKIPELHAAYATFEAWWVLRTKGAHQLRSDELAWAAYRAGWDAHGIALSRPESEVGGTMEAVRGQGEQALRSQRAHM